MIDLLILRGLKCFSKDKEKKERKSIYYVDTRLMRRNLTDKEIKEELDNFLNDLKK
jgi:hypothetical protein